MRGFSAVFALLEDASLELRTSIVFYLYHLHLHPSLNKNEKTTLYQLTVAAKQENNSASV
jgi:hypothetical protein